MYGQAKANQSLVDLRSAHDENVLRQQRDRNTSGSLTRTEAVTGRQLMLDSHITAITKGLQTMVRNKIKIATLIHYNCKYIV